IELGKVYKSRDRNQAFDAATIQVELRRRDRLGEGFYPRRVIVDGGIVLFQGIFPLWRKSRPPAFEVLDVVDQQDIRSLSDKAIRSQRRKLSFVRGDLLQVGKRFERSNICHLRTCDVEYLQICQLFQRADILKVRCGKVQRLQRRKSRQSRKIDHVILAKTQTFQLAEVLDIFQIIESGLVEIKLGQILEFVEHAKTHDWRVLCFEGNQAFQVQQLGDILNSCIGDVQVLQPVRILDKLNVGSRRIGQIETFQKSHIRDRCQVGNDCVGDVDDLEISEFRKRF